MDDQKQQHREQKTQQNKFWLQTNVNDALEPMMLAVCQEQPADQISFMLAYLEKKYGERATQGDKNNLYAMRTEVTRLEQLVKEQKEATAGSSNDMNNEPRGSEDESEASEEDDYVEVLPEQLAKAKKKGPRASVSAEAFGAFNKKEDFKARVVPKSNEAKAAIMDKISNSFMFSALEDSEKEIVANAMEEKKAFKKEVVIQEGDEGDCLYVVAEGTLSCTKIFKGNTEPTFLKRYEPGEAFGELALLYNAPRAATIFSDDQSLLYVLDRPTFNHIVKGAAMRRREKYESFLKNVELLKTMDDYERSQVAEAFKDTKFNSGDVILKEGEEGRDMFFLLEGEAFASKNIDGKDTEVKAYKLGDYFGELALLRNEPRAASIIAKTPCSTVSIDRHAFKRLLGPLEELLKRNVDLYTQFKKKD